MKTIKLTRGYEAIVDDEDYEKLNQFKWYHHTSGYAVRSSSRIGGKQRGIKMHRQINNTPYGFDTDRINRNKLDNRRSNLRTCTRSQNKMNMPAQNNNKLGVKGVCRSKRANTFTAQISIEGQIKYLGSYKTIKEAAIVYNKEAIKLFGKFALLNNISIIGVNTLCE